MELGRTSTSLFFNIFPSGWKKFPRPPLGSRFTPSERGWRREGWRRGFILETYFRTESTDTWTRATRNLWRAPLPLYRGNFSRRKLFPGETSPFICMRCRNRFTLYLYRCINKGLEKGKGWRWINRTDLDGNRGWVSGRKVSSFHLYRVEEKGWKKRSGGIGFQLTVEFFTRPILI